MLVSHPAGFVLEKNEDAKTIPFPLPDGQTMELFPAAVDAQGNAFNGEIKTNQLRCFRLRVFVDSNLHCLSSGPGNWVVYVFTFDASLPSSEHALSYQSYTCTVMLASIPRLSRVSAERAQQRNYLTRHRSTTLDTATLPVELLLILLPLLLSVGYQSASIMTICSDSPAILVLLLPYASSSSLLTPQTLRSSKTQILTPSQVMTTGGALPRYTAPHQNPPRKESSSPQAQSPAASSGARWMAN